MKLKLLAVEPSILALHKYRADFRLADGTLKHVWFGDRRYHDYTTHKDVNRRESYRARHRHDKLTDPLTPGTLSYYLLWGETTSLRKNIALFRKRFGI